MAGELQEPEPSARQAFEYLAGILRLWPKISSPEPWAKRSNEEQSLLRQHESFAAHAPPTSCMDRPPAGRPQPNRQHRNAGAAGSFPAIVE